MKEPDSILIAQTAVKKALQTYKEQAVTPTGKAHAAFAIDTFELLSNVLIEAYMVNHFMDVYRFAYAGFFQEQHREFLAKERGQFRNFIKLYDTITAYNMIVYYLQNNEKFTFTGPSIGHLLALRDKVFHAMKGKTKPVKTKSREEKDSEF